MNKFEKLIEYVINDEDAKAQDLFHEIVVEKSREIYENLMSEEDEVDDLIDDIEADEEGVAEAEEDEMDMDMDMDMGDDEGEDELEVDAEEGEEEDLEDRVVDLEDQMETLMAEFEALMADEAEEPEHADMFGAEEGDMEEGMFESEEEVSEDEDEDAKALEEGVALKAAPAPVKSEEGSVNKKSSVAANAGAKGAEAKPHQKTGEEKGRTAPTAQDLIGEVGNTPARSTQKPSAAPKAKVKGEESGTNAKSTL
jgi:hypothetical protein